MARIGTDPKPLQGLKLILEKLYTEVFPIGTDPKPLQGLKPFNFCSLIDANKIIGTDPKPLQGLKQK